MGHFLISTMAIFKIFGEEASPHLPQYVCMTHVYTMGCVYVCMYVLWVYACVYRIFVYRR